MNCESVIRELSNYLDGDLDAAIKQELERHLGDCDECALIVVQTRKSIEILCHCQPVALPTEVRSRLHAALRKKLRANPH